MTIAHRSGGPEADIIVPLPNGEATGFLAETPEEYASAMALVFASCNARNNGDVSEGMQAPQPGGEGWAEAGTGARAAAGAGAGALNGNVRPFSTLDVRVAGRESARRFSNEVFDRAFSHSFADLLTRKRSIWCSPDLAGGEKRKQG